MDYFIRALMKINVIIYHKIYQLIFSNINSKDLVYEARILTKDGELM